MATAARTWIVCLALGLAGFLTGCGTNTPESQETVDAHAGNNQPPADTPNPIPDKITSSIGMKLVLIPAGKFLMGSPENENDHRPEEGPPHEVEITKPFYMGIYEVTQEEYERVMRTNHRSEFSPNGGRKKHVEGMDTRKFPVEMVSWFEAAEFCRKLSELEGEKRAGRAYRLPTEAEWEYACRAGTKTVFHYGDSLSSEQANFNGRKPYGGAKEGKDLERPTTVGSYPPNAFGLYDMHGNICEWCADWCDDRYYEISARKDPQGPSDGNRRVLRGGSWGYYGLACRAAIRPGVEPISRGPDVGFRVVMTVAGTR